MVRVTMARGRLLAPLGAAAVVFVSSGSTAQPAGPTLRGVLDGAGGYVAAYEEALGSLVADESYRQDVSFPAFKSDRYGPGNRMLAERVRTRDLRSEFFVARIPGSDQFWLGLRDVLSVNGRNVPDRAPLAPWLDAARDIDGQQLRQLVELSARYNIGTPHRTVNVPTFGLLVVRPELQARFTFEKTGERRMEGQRLWTIDFVEHGRPTLVRGSGDADLPLSGSILVDPVSGRVWRTELVTDEAATGVRAQVTVTYRRDRRLEVLVPTEMRERYHYGRGNTLDEERIECLARYSNYRRFETRVRLLPPP